MLGLDALYKNGVSASSGGFLEILCTMRGSPTLNGLAAKGSLGGDENILKELEKLQIMFGKLSGKNFWAWCAR